MDDLYSSQPFADPYVTAKGDTRASVAWTGLATLWLNTGTLCNIECANCYIESSPKNHQKCLRYSGGIIFVVKIASLC